jgi:DNA-binding CsgD family transcriptional regulator
MRSEASRRIISSIHDAALVPDLWPAALQSIMDAVGAVGAGYGVFDEQTGRIEWLSETGALADAEADFLRYYHALDVLSVAPLGASLALQERPLALIVVAGPDAPSSSERELAGLFGLSPSESRLAAALMTGKRLRDVAGASGVRISTLRTQLSSILRKVGVNRQIDLVRVLSRIPGIGSSRGDAT